MWNAGLDEAQAGNKIVRRNINNLRYADDTPEEELKNLLMKMKVESEKAGLKLNIQKMKIIASGPIISCQIDGETMETVRDFIFWGSKTTADGDCSHEIKRHMLLGIKTMNHLNSILKNRDIADKHLTSQSYGFSSSQVWMWELDHKEGWALKNWCFWTVVLEKTLESPLDSQSKSTLNIHWRTEAEALILWPPDGKSWSTGKDLNPGKDWGQEEKEVTEDERVG